MLCLASPGATCMKGRTLTEAVRRRTLRMHGRDPAIDRPEIAEAALSRRSAVHGRHRGAIWVRGQHDSSQAATRRGARPTERADLETAARREHRHRLEPSDGLCRWPDGD